MKMKITLNNFGNSDCREYQAPSGAIYTFYKGIPTEVANDEDALHFLNAANGTGFSVEGVRDKIILALQKAVGKVDKDELDEPKKGRILKEVEDELKSEKEKVISEPVEVKSDKENKTPESVLTEEGIKKFVKDEQVFLIKKIMGDSAEIPKYEAERVKLLFELQKEGNNLIKILSLKNEGVN